MLWFVGEIFHICKKWLLDYSMNVATCLISSCLHRRGWRLLSVPGWRTAGYQVLRRLARLKTPHFSISSMVSLPSWCRQMMYLIDLAVRCICLSAMWENKSQKTFKLLLVHKNWFCKTISDSYTREQFLELFDLQFGFARNLQTVVEVVPGCKQQLLLRIGAVSSRFLTPERLMNILDLHDTQRYALCLEPLSPSPFLVHPSFSQVSRTFLLL